jgi:methionyl-tRNA formyltransferase
MTHTSKTILFFGTDSFSVSALRHLINAGYTIGAVITKPDTRSGRGQKLTPPAVKVLAEQHAIPVWQPTKLDDIINDITAFDQPIGVLSSFGRIVPQRIIDLFSPGIINVHPSLLPKYRGPSPIETAIVNGDTETGVSIMLLSAAMDAGPVYAQATYSLDGTETQATLYERLADLGSSLLIQHLPRIIDGSLQPRAQDDAGATYTSLLKKEDARVDPTTVTAEQLARMIRAYHVFPKTKLTLSGQLLTITAAHASPVRTSLLDVTCKEGFLVVDELIGPSGRRMDGHAFLNGYQR